MPLVDDASGPGGAWVDAGPGLKDSGEVAWWEGGQVGPRRTGEMQVWWGVLPVSWALRLRSTVDWSTTANIPEH